MNRVILVFAVVGIILNACNSTKNIEPIAGERVDGPANMRDTVNGKILFTLNDNTLVEAGKAEGKWQQIGTFVKLSKAEADSFFILPDADLYSPDGKLIGKAVHTVYLMMVQEDNTGFISAYTHVDNIKSKSAIENVLSKKLKEGEVDKQHLNDFIEDFKLEAYDLGELGYREYFTYESMIEDISPRDRVTLLFDKGEKLVAVIHSRELKTPQYKTYNLVRGHKLTVTSNMPKAELDSLMAKRIRFYNSVD